MTYKTLIIMIQPEYQKFSRWYFLIFDLDQLEPLCPLLLELDELIVAVRTDRSEMAVGM